MVRKSGIKYPKDSVWTVKKNKWFAEGEEVRLESDGFRPKKNRKNQFAAVVNFSGRQVKSFPTKKLKKRIR